MIWEKIGGVSNAELGFGGDEGGDVGDEAGINVDEVVRGDSEVRYAV